MYNEKILDKKLSEDDRAFVSAVSDTDIEVE